MSGTNSSAGGITRRSFLKTTGAVAGAAALAGTVTPTLAAFADESGQQSEGAEEQIFSGICRGNCFQGCFVNFRVRDGKVVGVTARDFPDEAYNRICPKGLSLPQRIYNVDRVKYPMKRVGERGADEWERISWDEAIDLIATTWKDLIATYGRNCIAQTSTAGTTGMSTNALSMLFSLVGAVSVASNVDNALFKGTQDTLGYNVMQNSANDSTDIENARTIILWASNITESQIQQWHFIADAKEKGATLICIDPNFTATAAKSDIFVPIRPGTDSALAMGMMNIVLENGWEDIDFLKRSTVAPLLVKEDGTYLRTTDFGASSDAASDSAAASTAASAATLVVWDEDAGAWGLASEVANPAIEGEFEIEGFAVRPAYSLLLERIAEYTPERASEICDVPVDFMRRITEIYSTNTPSWIYEGLGFNHYVNGHTAYHGCATLAMLTGNLGKSGASCGFIRPGDMYQYVTDLTQVLTKAAVAGDMLGSASCTISSNKFPEAVLTGKYAGFDTPIKSLFVFKSNYLGTMTDRLAKIEAFNAMDLVIVDDMYMTDTARYADLVLPIVDFAEQTDIHNRTTYPYTLLQEKAIEPLYEAKTDLEIAGLIAEKLGLGEYFKRSQEEYLRDNLGEENWNQILEDKCIKMNYYTDHYIHGEDGTYPTPTLRAQFYFETPGAGLYGDTPYGAEVDYEKERMVYWEPPEEAWHENELYGEYPLVLWQEHAKWRTHTQFGYVPWLREMDPEPVVKMSQEDAEARGIKTGDVVRVFNDRGYVVLKAIVNNGARPGMVNIPHGWQEDQFIEGHYCDLLNPAMHPLLPNQCYNDCLVEIEKYEEA